MGLLDCSVCAPFLQAGQPVHCWTLHTVGWYPLEGNIMWGFESVQCLGNFMSFIVCASFQDIPYIGMEKYCSICCCFSCVFNNSDYLHYSFRPKKAKVRLFFVSSLSWVPVSRCGTARLTSTMDSSFLKYM